MNETGLSDEIDILQATTKCHWDRIQHQARQIHDLTMRLDHIERLTLEPQDTLNRRLKALDEKWSAGGLTCDELDERAWLVKRINQMTPPPTVGNAYTSPEGWEAKQKAVETKCCGHDPQTVEDAKIGKAWREDSSLEKWFPFSAAELKNANEAISDAHRCLNTYQIPAASCLRDRIEHLRFAKLPKWRDAKSDPPTKPGHYIVHFVGADRTTTLDFDGYYWVYCDTKTPLANPFIVARWQELPPPPQATEKV